MLSRECPGEFYPLIHCETRITIRNRSQAAIGKTPTVDLDIRSMMRDAELLGTILDQSVAQRWTSPRIPNEILSIFHRIQLIGTADGTIVS